MRLLLALIYAGQLTIVQKIKWLPDDIYVNVSD